jgi:hypothetical protein
MRRSSLFLLLIAFFATSVYGQSNSAAGTWDLTLNSPQGSFEIQLVLKQEGDKVTGVVKGRRGELPIEGTIKAKDFTLKYTTKYQENDLPITLTGSIDGTAMKGTCDYGGFAQGDFNGKRGGESASTAGAPAAPAAAAQTTNITGAWIFQVETGQGSGTPSFDFKQEGEKLTGQYKGAFGEAPLTGTVKGNAVEFTINVEAQGQKATLTYKGTIEKDGTMKGTVELGDVGSGTWTGKRK